MLYNNTKSFYAINFLMSYLRQCNKVLKILFDTLRSFN